MIVKGRARPVYFQHVGRVLHANFELSAVAVCLYTSVYDSSTVLTIARGPVHQSSSQNLNVFVHRSDTPFRSPCGCTEGGHHDPLRLYSPTSRDAAAVHPSSRPHYDEQVRDLRVLVSYAQGLGWAHKVH